MSSNGQDVRKMLERLQRRVGQLEHIAAYQDAKIKQLEGLLTGQGLEIDTAQRALLQWMGLSGEHWAALRQEAMALRTAGMTCYAIFAGWSEAFAHLIAPAAEAAEDESDEDVSALPTPVGGDNAGAVL